MCPEVVTCAIFVTMKFIDVCCLFRSLWLLFDCFEAYGWSLRILWTVFPSANMAVTCATRMPLQARAEVTQPITQAVGGVVSHIEDANAVAQEIGALLNYVQHVFTMREVAIQRKQWEDTRLQKVSEATAKAMKQWDEQHYPRLLQATWGWHPFYSAFLANPLCAAFIPAYPLSHSVIEAWDTHEDILKQSSITKVYPVPWSVLLLRCFLKYYTILPPVLLHPQHGLTGANLTKWLKLAGAPDGDGRRAWHLAVRYLKEDGFITFAGARPVETQQQWVADVEAAWRDLRNPSPQWWTELRHWCNSTQFRAFQDMAFHEKELWMKAWVIRDPPTAPSAALARYERWIQFREDLDIGYVLANPGDSASMHL